MFYQDNSPTCPILLPASAAPSPARQLIRASHFSTALSNRPQSWRGTLETLWASLDKDRKPARHPEGADPKKYLPALSGAIYEPGQTRGKSNVSGLQLLILDVDNAMEVPAGEYHPSGRPKLAKVRIECPATIADFREPLSRQGIAAYLYSTWSSTEQWPRFRAVIPLAVPVPADYWPNLVAWTLTKANLLRWTRCIDLPCVQDVARLNFLPAQRPGGPQVERCIIPGDLLVPPEPAELLLHGVLKRELAPWQVQALEETLPVCPAVRSGKCSFAKRFRTRDGQPVDVRRLDVIRILVNLGCSVGPGRPWGPCTKYRTTCPWHSEHTDGLDDDSAVLFVEPGRWPRWHCSHACHAHLGLVDILETAGFQS